MSRHESRKRREIMENGMEEETEAEGKKCTTRGMYIHSIGLYIYIVDFVVVTF